MLLNQMKVTGNVLLRLWQFVFQEKKKNGRTGKHIGLSHDNCFAATKTEGIFKKYLSVSLLFFPEAKAKPYYAVATVLLSFTGRAKIISTPSEKFNIPSSKYLLFWQRTKGTLCGLSKQYLLIYFFLGKKLFCLAVEEKFNWNAYLLSLIEKLRFGNMNRERIINLFLSPMIQVTIFIWILLRLSLFLIFQLHFKELIKLQIMLIIFDTFGYLLSLFLIL